ncbi:hypothetical protein Syun_022614 [Stephania yunnanensis]|uniref:Uncharacterized protein n=1 Tax=Stephania yunnanensis TaxID=152371 RepID=A0AAP0HYP9_9MAGN
MRAPCAFAALSLRLRRASAASGYAAPAAVRRSSSLPRKPSSSPSAAAAYTALVVGRRCSSLPRKPSSLASPSATAAYAAPTAGHRSSSPLRTITIGWASRSPSLHNATSAVAIVSSLFVAARTLSELEEDLQGVEREFGVANSRYRLRIACIGGLVDAKLQRRRHELTQTTPDQPVDDEAVYYKVAGKCPKGRVYGLGSLGRKKRRYADDDASTSYMLAQRGMGNFMILSDTETMGASGEYEGSGVEHGTVGGRIKASGTWVYGKVSAGNGTETERVPSLKTSSLIRSETENGFRF